MSNTACLSLLLASTIAAQDPAEQTTNGALSQAAAERPPLWQVYYDRGMKAMRDKDYADALDQLGKDRRDLTNEHGASKPTPLAELDTQIAFAYLEAGTADKHSNRRENHLMSAGQYFSSAREQIQALHGADSLEYADATDRLADARAAYAEHRNGALVSYLNALAPDFISKENVADLYEKALAIREQRFGETHPDVVKYRRKVLRQLRTWLRTANALRCDVTDIKVKYEYDPIIEAYRERAEESKLRDRALGRGDEATSNGGA